MIIAVAFIMFLFFIAFHLFLNFSISGLIHLIFFAYPVAIRLRWLHKTFLAIRNLEETFTINEDEMLSQLTDDKHPVYNASTGEWIGGLLSFFYVPTKKTGPYITKDWMICLSEKPWLVRIADIKGVKQVRDTTLKGFFEISIGTYSASRMRRVNEAVTHIILSDGTVQTTSISTSNLDAAMQLISVVNSQAYYEKQ